MRVNRLCDELIRRGLNGTPVPVKPKRDSRAAARCAEEFVARSSSQPRRSGSPRSREAPEMEISQGSGFGERDRRCWSYIAHCRRHGREGQAQKAHEGQAVHPKVCDQVRVVVMNVAGRRGEWSKGLSSPLPYVYAEVESS